MRHDALADRTMMCMHCQFDMSSVERIERITCCVAHDVERFRTAPRCALPAADAGREGSAADRAHADDRREGAAAGGPRPDDRGARRGGVCEDAADRASQGAACGVAAGALWPI